MEAETVVLSLDDDGLRMSLKVSAFTVREAEVSIGSAVEKEEMVKGWEVAPVGGFMTLLASETVTVDPFGTTEDEVIVNF